MYIPPDAWLLCWPETSRNVRSWSHHLRHARCPALIPCGGIFSRGCGLVVRGVLFEVYPQNRKFLSSYNILINIIFFLFI